MSSATTFNVFDSWSEYRVHILFMPWYTSTVMHFVLSCLGLFLMSLLVAVLVATRTEMIDRRRRAQKTAEERARLLGGGTDPTPVKKLDSLACWYTGFVMIIISLYILGALVGLAMMSFNPWVFMSIILGYFTGDVMTVHFKLKL